MYGVCASKSICGLLAFRDLLAKVIFLKILSKLLFYPSKTTVGTCMMCFMVVLMTLERYVVHFHHLGDGKCRPPAAGRGEDASLFSKKCI